MKLASLKDGRDGRLIVVDRKLEHAVEVPDIASNLLQALENWSELERDLQRVYSSMVDTGGTTRPAGEPTAHAEEAADTFPKGKTGKVFALNLKELAAALPRAPQFVDGSAYLAHVERVRKARGAVMPPSFLSDPLMYQAVSDKFLAPTEPIQVANEAYGIDFESEVGVIVDDVPMGVTPEQAGGHIKLLVLINDVSLRNLIPAELGKGFGFLQGKPRSALSAIAVTPGELADTWKNGKVHLPLVTQLNGQPFGQPDAGLDMQFSFPQLIAHAAKTRPLAAGTLVGSGTVANRDESKGSSCLAERRMLEIIKGGEAKTPFLKFGDRVRIEMFDKRGASIFGAIDQAVEQYSM